MLDTICLGEPCEPAIRIAQVLGTALLGVLFLQSGLDKVFNWRGELGWISEHFAKTPLRGFVPQLLGVVTLLEVASGISCLLGSALLLGTGDPTFATLGATLAGATLLQLFAGQRIAKDYPGAASIAPYFLIALGTLALLAAR